MQADPVVARHTHPTKNIADRQASNAGQGLRPAKTQD